MPKPRRLPYKASGKVRQALDAAKLAQSQLRPVLVRPTGEVERTMREGYALDLLNEIEKALSEALSIGRE
jgi:hypothetical protein